MGRYTSSVKSTPLETSLAYGPNPYMYIHEMCHLIIVGLPQKDNKDWEECLFQMGSSFRREKLFISTLVVYFIMLLTCI